jgi:hypothetical protein
MVAFGPLRSTRLLGPREYQVHLVRYRVYSVAWAATSVMLAIYWGEVMTLLKFVLVPLIVLGTPAIGVFFSDIRQVHSQMARGQCSGRVMSTAVTAVNRAGFRRQLGAKNWATSGCCLCCGGQ